MPRVEGLTVKVTRARCTIKVVYDTVASSAQGVGAKTGTTITWRWRVGPRGAKLSVNTRRKKRASLSWLGTSWRRRL